MLARHHNISEYTPCSSLVLTCCQCNTGVANAPSMSPTSLLTHTLLMFVIEEVLTSCAVVQCCISIVTQMARVGHCRDTSCRAVPYTFARPHPPSVSCIRIDVSVAVRTVLAAHSLYCNCRGVLEVIDNDRPLYPYSSRVRVSGSNMTADKQDHAS